MKIGISGATLIMLAFATSGAAVAHGVGKVRKELTDQGYEDLEFQRTRPPFKLDACKDGTIYHLHVDFYGKIIQKKAVGDCSGVEPAVTDDGSAAEDDAADQDTRITDQARSRAWRYWGNDYIERENGN
jgi:hypothetical protein